MKEEMCASSRLSFALNKEGQTLSINKDGPGGIPYSKLQDVITVRVTAIEEDSSTSIPTPLSDLIRRWLKKWHVMSFTG